MRFGRGLSRAGVVIAICSLVLALSGPSAPSAQAATVSPHVGILGTPIIDPPTNTLYALAYNLIGGANQHRLYAIDLTTHTISWSTAADPIPSITNVEQQRPALALSNGTVYVAYGGL